MKEEKFIPTIDLTDPLNPRSNVKLKRNSFKYSKKIKKFDEEIRKATKNIWTQIRTQIKNNP